MYKDLQADKRKKIAQPFDCNNQIALLLPAALYNKGSGSSFRD